MNYTDQEGCQIENCEDSLEPKRLGQTSSSERVVQDRSVAGAEDESVIGDNWPRDDNDGQIPVAELKSEETTSQRLMRQRHHERKAARHRGKQYRKESPNEFDASTRHESRLKSMRPKITRKGQRRVPSSSRYLDGDFEKRDGTLAGAMVRK